MLNLKNNENEAVFDEKKSEDQNKISKNEGYFFGQHPVVEKSPTATGTPIYIKYLHVIHFKILEDVENGFENQILIFVERFVV